MLKLIEGEGDSFAKKAEMYYKRRPEIVSHVEDLYRMYRALAERYDHLTGELRKNVPASPENRAALTSPSLSPLDKETFGHVSPRSPGLKLFLDPKKMDKGASSSSGSGSESEEGVETDVSLSRVLDLEAQLGDAQEMIQLLQKEKICLEMEKNSALEESVRALEEKVREREKEVEEMRTKLLREKLKTNEWILQLQQEKASIEMQKNSVLEGSLRDIEEKVREREKEIEEISASFLREKSRLELEIETQSAASNQIIQRMREKEGLEMEKNSALEESLRGLETKVRDRERETEEMRASFLREKSRLELEIQTQHAAAKETIQLLRQEKESLEMEKKSLEAEKALLEETLREREEFIKEVGVNFHQEKCRLEMDELHLREKLDVYEEEKRKLEMELESERAVVLDVAEKKREAIRQLCFSLQHYRDGYNELRQALLVHQRPLSLVSS